MVYNPSSSLLDYLEREELQITRRELTEVCELFEKTKWRLCVWLIANKDFNDFRVDGLLSLWDGCMRGRPRNPKTC